MELQPHNQTSSLRQVRPIRLAGMKGSLSEDMEVGLPAGELWAVYSTIRLAELAVELAPNVVAKFDILEGDGGVGTLLKVFFPSGTPGPEFHKERFVKIDNENRIKEADVVEGGYLELGFSSYFIRFEITEKDVGSCILKCVIEYEISDELAEYASLVTAAPFVALGEAIAKHLIEKKANASTS